MSHRSPPQTKILKSHFLVVESHHATHHPSQAAHCILWRNTCPCITCVPNDLFSPQSGKFNIFATTTKICDQTSHPERNHNWGLHCNQIPFPAFVLKIETFLEWLQFMPASNSGPAPYAYSPDCHLVVTCCRIVVTASQRESSFYSRQSDVNHSLWFGQTQDIIGKNYLLKTLCTFT